LEEDHNASIHLEDQGEERGQKIFDTPETRNLEGKSKDIDIDIYNYPQKHV
jgi:hypothetical protein